MVFVSPQEERLEHAKGIQGQFSKLQQHEIVLKLALPGSKVYASGKFVCGLFVSSLSAAGQIPHNEAQRIGGPKDGLTPGSRAEGPRGGTQA